MVEEFEASLKDAPEKITFSICTDFVPRTFVHAAPDGTGYVTEFFATARRALQHFPPRLYVDYMHEDAAETTMTLYDPKEANVFRVTKRVHTFAYTVYQTPPEYVIKLDSSDAPELYVDSKIGDLTRIRGFFETEYPGRLAPGAKPSRKLVFEGPRLFVLTPGDWEIDLKKEAIDFRVWRMLLSRGTRRKSSLARSETTDDQTNIEDQSHAETQVDESVNQGSSSVPDTQKSSASPPKKKSSTKRVKKSSTS